MKIEYSKDIDALYIRLKNTKVADTLDIEEGVVLDLDEHRHVVGIEILDVSDKMEISDLVNITIENLPLEKVSS